MQKIARRSFQFVAAFTLCAALVGGCATTPAVPIKPDELDGAKYKLAVISGRMDQRVVQFRKKGHGLLGILVSKGRVLQEMVGIADDMEMFRLTPAAGADTNSYEGVYISYQGDGSRSEQEVKVTFYKDSFNWNLESATWERVQD